MGLGVSKSLTERGFADLTNVTLVDKNTNSVLTDNANKPTQGYVAMQMTQPGGHWPLAKLVKLMKVVSKCM